MIPLDWQSEIRELQLPDFEVEDRKESPSLSFSGLRLRETEVGTMERVIYALYVLPYLLGLLYAAEADLLSHPWEAISLVVE